MSEIGNEGVASQEHTNLIIQSLEFYRLLEDQIQYLCNRCLTEQ